jgi:peptidoglycan/xylan/chitin deacetylase (PgdA/CDA1 family)
VLSALRRAHAHATFYVLGSQIGGRERLLRRALGQGNEVADHSWSHPSLPSFAQIRNTSARIRQATGFRPCLFRPPYGTVNSRLVANARRVGMRTIDWDVDPKDWGRPGARQIAARVVGHVHPGSIVIMHDGGANRSQTVAALPSILRRLRHRGYRFVTTSELLGGRLLWRTR